MSGHTPGPWRVSDENGYIYACYDGDPNWCVGKAYHAPQPGTSKSAMEANARLIAAAPDMYALIAGLGDAIADMFDQMNRGNWTDDNGHDVRMNKQMLNLKGCLQKAIELRAPFVKSAEEKQ